MISQTEKRILVTGGSGFIGTNLVSSLMADGHTVLNCDIQPPQCQSHDKLFANVDIRNKPALTDIFRQFNPTHVVHLAARTDLHERKDIQGYNTNFEGVQNIIDVIVEQSSVERCIFTSSRLVCKTGYIPKGDDDYCPTTLYGQSKVMGEKIVKESTSLNVVCCIVRPTSIWGPWSLLPYNPYGKFFQMVACGRYFHPGRADPQRSYGYVGNTVFQINALLNAVPTQIDKKVFYLSDYEPITIKQWASRISQKLRNKNIKSIPEPFVWLMAWAGDFMKQCGYKEPPFSSFRLQNMRTDTTAGVNITSIQSVTGPLPFSMESGVDQTIAWLKEQGLAK